MKLVRIPMQRAGWPVARQLNQTRHQLQVLQAEFDRGFVGSETECAPCKYFALIVMRFGRKIPNC